MATSPNSTTAFAWGCNQHLEEWLTFTDEETKKQKTQRLNIAQNWSKIQTSTQIFKVELSPLPVELPFPSWLSTGKGSEQWVLSERGVRVFRLFLPPTMRSQAEPQYLESKSRVAPVRAGVRVVGQTPDPPSTHCSFLPSPPTSGPDTLDNGLGDSVERSGE